MKTKLLTLTSMILAVGCNQDLQEFAKLQKLKQLGGKCTPGKVLSISIDMDEDGVFETKRGSITSYSGALTSLENYNYYSWSAHPVNGPIPAGFESHVFLYEGADGLSLNMYHNVDAGGSANNQVSWNILTQGNNNQDSIILQDDQGEVALVGADPNNFMQLYTGSWQYWHNTDGVVLGPFQGEEFSMVISEQFGGDIGSVGFYSADGNFFDLSNETGDLYSFEIKFEDDQTCEGFEELLEEAQNQVAINN